ncbi:hypothetical protein KCM76_19615 [Zooshikella marina]|uniref:sensor histidine kinase n=1 Tax=Zooshikella ganghwensis TaxID=202772 RepID=UPI001BB05B63|nr:ATP-binding protein [Zooshikella ganghwensis]MBU2708210.1 hypothetical protein [Zooshikella ganghwensis]
MLEKQELLSFLYQTPYGIISADNDGVIDMMNAYAVQLMIPLVPNLQFHNLYCVLEKISPSLIPKIKNFTGESGSVCENYRVMVSKKNNDDGCWFDFSIYRININHWMIGFYDSSMMVIQENRAKQEAMKRADSLARLDMATSVIHDIGNAITAIGISSAKLVAKDNWEEINNLQRVTKLMKSNSSNLDECLGIGKGKALTEFITSICSALESRQRNFIESSQSIARNVHHIQDIISIQKQFARDGEGTKQLPVSIRNIIFDAEAVVHNLLIKTNTQCIINDIPTDMYVKGDKTRLTQVIVNTLKNSCEAVVARNDKISGEILISTLFGADNCIQININDNGVGFDSEIGKKISDGNYTSKIQGSGIGLNNSRSVIESHGGRMELTSEGIDKGCCLSITLPVIEEA